MSPVQRRALLSVLALLALALIIAPVSAAQVCAGRGLAHENPPHGGPITLTDWTNNQTHTYLSLDCAVQAMRADYEWSRARWTSPAGQEITLTRARDRWDADPADAILVQVQSPGRPRPSPSPPTPVRAGTAASSTSTRTSRARPAP